MLSRYRLAILGIKRGRDKCLHAIAIWPDPHLIASWW